ncbi:MAG: quinolinate synthase NadA [Alphaproteobacteria bacterium]|nr:quinolinate synthase NadA [Alphaproteobacteria bacterium]
MDPLRPSTEPFPSLIVQAEALSAQGAFAEAQATFLQPDPAAVEALDALLRRTNTGVVAHFYMDAELQGVLSAASWPHVFISDSLAMADAGTRMVEAGVENIVVLGVDFMSENVRAVLDHNGHTEVPVYRVAAEAIGCTLAESAEARAYGAWLTKAAAQPNALHVIYINTSLDVKARSHALVPTITCTSSNVVRTVLQADAQIPDLRVFYGPDTYMGQNLVTLFNHLADHASDAEIRALHPAHTRDSLRRLLGRFDYFRQGSCAVHQMFGADVARRVRRDYADAFHTAHLEVPGEMFALAAEAQRQGRGVVGSTSNILDFILDKLAEATSTPGARRLRFVLGTESGMVTSIVRKAQAALRESGRGDVEVEIIFPVASEAVAQTDDPLGLVPGVAGGEGCSVEGGCASCPFMKMNSLDALESLLEGIGQRDLVAFEPRKYQELIHGRSAASLGSEPILHMRGFQATGALPAALVAQVTGRGAA